MRVFVVKPKLLLQGKMVGLGFVVLVVCFELGIICDGGVEGLSTAQGSFNRRPPGSRLGFA